MNLIRSALAALASLALSIPAVAQEINFGIITTDKAAALRDMWEPFIQDMRRETGSQS